MEALDTSLAPGELSGRAPALSQPRGQRSKSPSALQQPRPRRRQHAQRKRLRPQRQSAEPDEAEDANSAPASGPRPARTPERKRERKPQRPGKYVCTYCSRACAKPSVLQKHIRSHTGERPYPCGPCGFSFKTKSNLYKHRKSHTHRLKAGLAAGAPRPAGDPPSESDDETQQLSSALLHAEQRGAAAAELRSRETERSQDCMGGGGDSYAVKKRLALRLSRGKPSPGEEASPLTFGSKGSTESGYFSRSESTEQPQDEPPAGAGGRSYAEIVLGKYGRPVHPPRNPRQQSQPPPGQEDHRGVPFKYQKEQVIDHITKLITTNEAVVDTSTIDRVKPRRFSLSRKSSSESLKRWSVTGALIQAPRAAELGIRTSGSITMGVPCGRFHHPSPNVETPADTVPSPLVRSQSTPSSPDPPGSGSAKFRSARSLDQRSLDQRSRRAGTLRRQPAVELPLGAEPDGGSGGGDDWEDLHRHQCVPPQPSNQVGAGLTEDPAGAGASALRKRRKEESSESDEPPSSGVFPDSKDGASGAPRGPTPHTCSVIQHTSSFEKQESLSSQNPAGGSPPREEEPPRNQESAEVPRRLVRQNSVQVPEILVTEDSGLSAASSERPEDFLWPQRSPSLARLPIEKLPPKKKRLRLAEAAQSSGESSFDSASLSRSPSQDSAASYASSRSASFEEPNKPDVEIAASPSARRSRAAHMLAVPGAPQHKELRRSASEQTPHEPPSSAGLTQSRSKSFDYGCLSPERSALGWKERRKCLLIRHTAVRDPDEEEEEEEGLGPLPNPPNPEPLSPSRPSTGEGPQGHARPPPAAAQQPPPASSGAARARYLAVSTGLKLEIPPPRVEPAPLIAHSRELLRPLASPAVAVRLQADTLALAGAIYTTQAAAGRQERAAPRALDHKDLESGGHQRGSGSGGNKRLLSPADSLELPPEGRQQQKRVREEEGEREPGRVDTAPVEAQEGPSGGPSLPSLFPGTCTSWCYLNYTKPNPCVLDRQEPSVYSSWTTAGYDPNPPGLCSRTALSLLSCRQRCSASIYTSCPMSASTAEPEDGGRPRPEVYTSRSYSRDQDATAVGRGGVGDRSGAEQQQPEEEQEEGQRRSDRSPSAGGAPGTDVSQRSSEGGEHKTADGGACQTSTQLAAPEPERPAGGLALRRALFARRRLDATTTLQRPPTPPRSPSPGPLRSSTPPPSSPATSQGGARFHADSAAAARPGAGDAGPAHAGPQRRRGRDHLLGHLPLHSQQPGRAPSRLVPIGGIHLLQPRSLLPLYALESSPSLSPPWRFGHAPKRRSPLQRQESRASSPDQEDSGPGE